MVMPAGAIVHLAGSIVRRTTGIADSGQRSYHARLLDQWSSECDRTENPAREFNPASIGDRRDVRA